MAAASCRSASVPTTYSVTIPMMPRTATSQAKTRFIHEVSSVAGVIQVATYGGETLGESSILVFVPSLTDETAERVATLQGEILRGFPGARLDLEVNGLEELGATVETLHEWLPEGATVIHRGPNVPARQLAAAS
jgi:hypothetical protein